MADLGTKKTKHNSRSTFGVVYHTNTRSSERRLANERRIVTLEFLDEHLKGTGPIQVAITDLNLDLSGLGIIAGRRIEKGSKVKILFDGGTSGAAGHLLAEVMWSNELPVTGHIIKTANPEWRWRIGLKVLKQDSEESKNLILQLKEQI